MKDLLRAIENYQTVNGLSNGAFARLVGIDESYISYIKSGKRMPGRKFIQSVAKIHELRLAVYGYMIGVNGG